MSEDDEGGDGSDCCTSAELCDAMFFDDEFDGEECEGCCGDGEFGGCM